MAHSDLRTLRAFLADAARDIEPMRPVGPWSAWRGLSVAVGVAFVAGCGGQAEDRGGSEGTGAFPMGGMAYGIPYDWEDCSDGRDNDLDQLVDCDDPDCPCLETGGAGGEAGGTAGAGALPNIGGTAYGIPYEWDCSDGRDNDFDQLVDCDDPDCGCVATGGTGGTGGAFGGLGGMGGTDYGIPFELTCDNEYDDDFDGLTDCEDPDCACQGHGGAGGSAEGGAAGVVEGGTSSGSATSGGTPTGGSDEGPVGGGGFFPMYSIPF